jgi:hypothetical protein
MRMMFGSNGQTVGEQVLSWNLGVTSRASERLSVMVDYVGERRDGQLQNGVQLGLGYRFCCREVVLARRAGTSTGG